MMFNERFKLQDKDSLDEESISATNMNVNPFGDQFSNENNYDFLYDEEYQKMRLEKDNFQQQKWVSICDKVAFSHCLKDVYLTLDQLFDQLYRQGCQQEALLTDSSIIQPLQNNENQKQFKFSNQIKYKDLKMQIESLSEMIEKRVVDMVENDKDLCLQYKKQKQQAEKYKDQIHKQSYRTKDSDDEDIHQESYIEEIETQLQEARAGLLDKKLKLADKDEEIKMLKKQIQAMQANFNSLEGEKREIDSLIIKVSQEFKNKEFDVKDYTYQLSLEKEHLERQMDMLKRELQEERENKINLEIVEGDLIHKLQNNDQEISEMRQYMQEMEEKLEVKTDAIEKAQKIIQKLNEEMDRSGDLISKIEQEKDELRMECKEQNKNILELNKKLQSNVNQHYMESAQVNTQLKTEIDELKEALQQYQQEYGQEKRHLSETVKDLNEQKYHIQLEKEKSEVAIKQLNQKNQQLIESKDQEIQELQSKMRDLVKEMKELEVLQRQQIELKEQQAQSNIQYLQKRLKEVQYESYRGGNGKQSDSKLDPTSILITLKQEFDKVQKEVLQIKSIVKQESMDSMGISYRLNIFEEFKTQVFDSLVQWEQKTNDLTDFVMKQQNSFEEQRKLFQSMKIAIKEKDQLIYSYQKQLQQRTQTAKVHMGTIKKELERSHYLMKSDLMELIRAYDHQNGQIKDDNYEMERRFQTFKMEFAQILEDREYAKNENLRLGGALEITKRDLEKSKDDLYHFKERMRVILDIRVNGGEGHNLIYSEIENVLDELKVRKDEVLHYKAQIEDYQEQSDQEKKFLHSRIKSVEEQIDAISRQSLNKEEEQQVLHLQKETKYINEIQRLQTDLNAQQNETQIRERQMKKLQIKLDTLQQSNDGLLSDIDMLQKQINDQNDREQSTFNEMMNIQDILEKTQVDLDEKINRIGNMNDQIKISENKCNQLKEMNLEKIQDFEKERMRTQELDEELSKSNTQLEGSLDKVRILERENQSLYNELKRNKDTLNDVKQKYEEADSDRTNFQNAYEQMNQVVVDAQEQIVQSQQSIEQLNNALEQSKQKDYEISDLQYEIRMLQRNEKVQCEMIESMKIELNPERQSVEIQTNESGIQEIMYLRDEMRKHKKENRYSTKESEQVKDINNRLTLEIDRLIDEKIDLEQFIEHQNQSIKQIKIGQQAFKENTSSYINSSQKPQSMLNNNNDLLQQILQEKENYISKLESEIGGMRKENEHLQEKMIIHEIGTLTLQENDKSMTLRVKQGKTQRGGYQSLNISNIMPSNQKYGSNYPYEEEQMMHNKSMQYHL